MSFAFASLTACTAELTAPGALPSSGSAAGQSAGGTSGGDAGGGTGGTDAPPGGPYVSPTPASPALRARVWRLTHDQYRESVRDFLGTDVDTSAFEPEDKGEAFRNLASVGFVRLSLASSYYETAAAVAGALTEVQLSSLTGTCGSLTAACRDDFLQTAIKRGFRRPAAEDDLVAFRGVFDASASAGDATLPFRSVVQGILTSPFFLYRTEVGASVDASAASFRLTSHEVASLLSYSLLGKPPTAALAAAADRNELSSPSTARAQVDALLLAPEAAGPLSDFLVQWLRADRLLDLDLTYKFPNLFPGFDSVRAAMFDEGKAFLSTHGGMTGSLRELFTAPVPPATGELGAFYAGAGAGFGTRVGWLGLGAFLAVAAHSDIGSPTLRGLFVRDRLLCQKFTVPPNVPNLEDVEGMGAMPKSTRELYGLHSTRQECAGCHVSIDPVGFTFESFDAAGRFRTEELFRNQTVPVPVDTSGELVGTDVDRVLANHGELAEALAASAWVRECAAIQTFRYYFGFSADVPRGLPPVVGGYQALTAGGGMRDLLAAVMTSESTFERIRN